jgi:hypothetical protein
MVTPLLELHKAPAFKVKAADLPDVMSPLNRHCSCERSFYVADQRE